MIAAIEIETRDGVVLRGEVAMRASDWLLLVHAPGEDIDAWRPLSAQLADQQLTLLAVDLRGHGGSDGDPNSETSQLDVEAMLDYARSHMALRVFAAGAGASAATVLQIAEMVPIQGLVLISPTNVTRVADVRVPRLVIHDPEDADQASSADTLAEAPGWALGVSIAGAGRGRQMVQGDWGDSIAGYVIAFLRDVRLSHPDRLELDET